MASAADRNASIRQFVAQMMSQRGQTSKGVASAFEPVRQGAENWKNRQVAQEAQDKQLAQQNLLRQQQQAESTAGRKHALDLLNRQR